MAPIAEEVGVGEVAALGDLGLVAGAIELAPIAALGAVGYGLYELRSALNF